MYGQKRHADDRLEVWQWPDRKRTLFRILKRNTTAAANQAFVEQHLGPILQEFGSDAQLIFDYSAMDDTPPDGECLSWWISMARAMRLLGVGHYVRVVPNRLRQAYEQVAGMLEEAHDNVTVVGDVADAHCRLDELGSPARAAD